MADDKVTLTGNQIMQLVAQERQRLEQINSQLAGFQNMRNELNAAKLSIAEISKSKKGTKILLPLGAGIYAEAFTENNESAIISIENSTFKQKKFDELQKQLDKRLANIDRAMENIAQEQARAASRVNQLENVIAAGRQALKNQRGQ